MALLKNFWYVAEQSAAITNKPKRITILEQELVLFRNPEGQAIALNNLCAHRGGNLADGWIEDGCIRCPYHGWKYRSDGVCVEIPANSPDAAISKLACIDAYPVEEHYGWVWVFLGDLPEPKRPPLPPLPELSEPAWRAVYGTFRWNAPYTRVVENGLDITHLPFVHGFERQVIDSSDIHVSDWSGSLCANLKPAPSKGIWKYFTRRKEGASVKTIATFYMPNVVRQDIHLPGESRLVLYGVHVPVNEVTTLSWWVQLRNFLTHPWADGDARRRNLRAFLQDQQVVEAQRPELLPYDLSVRSDGLQIAYRQLHQKYLDLGWGVEQHRLSAASGRIQGTVIPSPARMQ